MTSLYTSTERAFLNRDEVRAAKETRMLNERGWHQTMWGWYWLWEKTLPDGKVLTARNVDEAMSLERMVLSMRGSYGY